MIYLITRTCYTFSSDLLFNLQNCVEKNSLETQINFINRSRHSHFPSLQYDLYSLPCTFVERLLNKQEELPSWVSRTFLSCAEEREFFHEVQDKAGRPSIINGNIDNPTVAVKRGALTETYLFTLPARYYRWFTTHLIVSFHVSPCVRPIRELSLKSRRLFRETNTSRKCLIDCS